MSKRKAASKRTAQGISIEEDLEESKGMDDLLSEDGSQVSMGEHSDMLTVPSFLLKTYEIVDVSSA